MRRHATVRASRPANPRRHVGDGEAVAHLALDAQLLGEDDLGDGARGDDEPEEEGRGERGRVVGRQDEVVEEEREGEVEDVGRAADDVVQEDDAAQGRLRSVEAPRDR